MSDSFLISLNERELLLKLRFATDPETFTPAFQQLLRNKAGLIVNVTDEEQDILKGIRKMSAGWGSGGDEVREQKMESLIKKAKRSAKIPHIKVKQERGLIAGPPRSQQQLDEPSVDPEDIIIISDGEDEQEEEEQPEDARRGGGGVETRSSRPSPAVRHSEKPISASSSFAAVRSMNRDRKLQVGRPKTKVPSWLNSKRLIPLAFERTLTKQGANSLSWVSYVYDLSTNKLVPPTSNPPSEVYRTYFNKLDDLLRFSDQAEYDKPLARAYAREKDGGDLLLLAAVIRQDMGYLRNQRKWNVARGERVLRKTGGKRKRLVVDDDEGASSPAKKTRSGQNSVRGSSAIL